jgi:hypothetical protein
MALDPMSRLARGYNDKLTETFSRSLLVVPSHFLATAPGNSTEFDRIETGWATRFRLPYW